MGLAYKRPPLGLSEIGLEYHFWKVLNVVWMKELYQNHLITVQVAPGASDDY